MQKVLRWKRRSCLTKVMARVGALCVLGLCIAALSFRVTLGIDLGDEAYYAAFVDGWLKSGLAHSPFLMVHQTADLLVYPFAFLYRAARGDADGLVLFLRFVYLGVSALSAACLYRALLPWRGQAVAVLTAMFALLFVPFGLPAPSYNTLGMCSLVAALSLFAAGFSQVFVMPDNGTARRFSPLLWLSGGWWALACIAYPPMMAPLVALLGLALATLRTVPERRLIRRYAMVCAVLLFVAFLTLCAALGPMRLLEMVRFTNAFNNVSGGGGGKFRAAVSALTEHPRFALLCFAAVFLAGARCLRGNAPRLICDMLLGALIVGVATSPAPTFFNRMHDLVLLLAISGLCIGIRPLLLTGLDADRHQRLFSLIFVVSVIGGLVTAATAFNGLFNFPIGGFLAAGLALVLPTSTTLPTRLSQLLVVVLCCSAMASMTFTTFYGQIGPISYREAVRVEHGAFAGLRTDVDQASFIDQLTAAIEKQRGCGNRFAVLGTGPGFYLMTTLAPSALSTWNYSGDASNHATEAVRAFYSVPENRPDVLVVNNWQWATPLSAADRALLDSYVLTRRVTVGLRDASVYRRVNCLSAG